jgi:hypothetical protein
MAERSNETLWREEFERLGEMQVYDNVKQGAIYNDEVKRQAAFRWLGEVAAVRRARELRSYTYVRWTFYAAVAAVIVGAIGIFVTLFH